ncbi:8-oxoguanine deaminase [Williamsia sp.]|uniref:8-oxoguanine deaminase n=1 Tax=Williamsia sp. TaxID=1872085 RepID=UPI002F93FF07
MYDTLFRDIGHLMLEPGSETSNAWLAVSDGRVAAVGTAGTEPEAAETRSLGGRLVTPGLINTHHHIYQNLTRSYGPVVNGSLFDWLTGLYPIWSMLDEEAVYVSTYIGLTELLLGGCTTSTDHLYVHPRPNLIDAQIRAADDIGFRFYPTRGSMSLSVKDGGLPPDSVTQTADVILEDSERLVKRYHDPKPGAMIRIGLAPCSPFSVDDTLMRATAELAEKHDVRMHTHLAEDTDEHTFCLEKYGRTPVEHFEDVGWAGPRSWVAHFIFPSDVEARRLATAGVGVAHCPSSNMLIGGGTARVQTLREHGVAVGLGCDGSASTDHASMWLEARTALLLARFQGGPTAMTARNALDIATVGSARCLGWDDELGQLTVGSVADLVAWHLDPVSLAGALSDPVEALLRCGPGRAWTTVVNGKVVVDEGQPISAVLPDMLREHRRIATRMQKAVLT